MSLRVGFLGTPGGVCFASLGFRRALEQIGLNTGNTIFQHALWTKIANPKFICSPFGDRVAIRDNCDLLIIPAANQVNPAFDLAEWADFIEAVDLPLVVIGLGAQTADYRITKLDLHEGTRRYIMAIAKRTSLIGVRGEFTRQVLEAEGITNTIITGCPSQTINTRLKGADIHARLEHARAGTKPLNVAHVIGTLEPHVREVERNIARMVASHRHSILLQTEPRMLRWVFEGAIPQDEENQNFRRWLANTVWEHIGSDRFDDYFLQRAKFYSDARSWIDQMRAFDLVIGMRIHGAVAAIQGGGLGVCVTFDSRTQELAESMGYPFVRSLEVTDVGDLPLLLSKIVFDPVLFDQSREIHTDRIYSLLISAGCTLSD